MAMVGAFLHPPDWPAWSTTLTADGDEATIEGATVVDADYLGQQALAVVIASREKCPIVADEGTRLYSLDRQEWTPISQIGVGEAVRSPDLAGANTIITWSRVKTIQRATEIERVFMGKQRMWGRLILKRPHQSFASPAAFIHQRATRIAEIHEPVQRA
jgi:hypothetical protein